MPSSRKYNPLAFFCLALGGSLLLMAANPQPSATTQPASQPSTTTQPTSQPSATTQPASKVWTKALPKEIASPPIKVSGFSAVMLQFTGGLKSYYEPCGCQADMLGGLPRLGALLAGYRHKGLLPLSVDAGNLFFETLHIPKSKLAQARIKSEMIADIFRMLGIQVIGVGPSDLVFGAERLKALVKRGGFQALASNLLDAKSNRLLFPSHTIVNWQGVRFGFLALTGTPTKPNLKDPWPKGFWSSHNIQLLDASKAAADAVKALKQQGAQRIVLLSTLGLQALERVLEKVKGIDVAIDGAEGVGLEQPKIVGQTFMLATQEEGQKSGSFAFYLRKNGLPWAAVVTAEQQKASIANMKKQVLSYIDQAKQMRAQGSDFEPIAKVYDGQAAQLRKEIARKSASISNKARLKAGHNGYLHALTPLGQKLGEHPAAAKRLARYEVEVKKANLLALQNIKPILKNAKGNFYVGAEQCRTCHMAAYDFWKKTRHADAYPTLVKKKKQFDLDCIGCHVVGWQKPGGLYDIKNPQRLAGVQCENCHSYGGLHTKTGKKTQIEYTITETTCKTCHQGSHDPKFDFHKRLKVILGKGHGEKRLKRLLTTGK